MTECNSKLPKTLLHACCGPCSTAPTRILTEEGEDFTVFFSNSNIAPRTEYDQRLATMAHWAQTKALALKEAPYNFDSWAQTAGSVGEKLRSDWGVLIHRDDGSWALVPADFCSPAPTDTPTLPADQSLEALLETDPDAITQAQALREARCRACYRLRFEEAARYAREQGFDCLGTSLSVSPYQYTTLIEEELTRAADTAGLSANFRDWRPFYDETVEVSREAELYRQNYCGCLFSAEEAAYERALRKEQRRAEKAQARAKKARELQEFEEARAQKKSERARYDAKQNRKREILKQLREQTRTTDS